VSFEPNYRWPHLNGVAELAPCASAQFGDQFNFHTSTHGQLGHTKSTAGVGAARSKYLGQQFAAAVRDQVLLGEGGRGVDQAEHFDNA